MLKKTLELSAGFVNAKRASGGYEPRALGFLFRLLLTSSRRAANFGLGTHWASLSTSRPVGETLPDNAANGLIGARFVTYP